MPEKLTGQVQTILGLKDGDALGTTLVHEHLLYDNSSHFKEPSLEIEKKQAYQPVSLKNLYLVRLNPFCCRDPQLTINAVADGSRTGRII